MSQYGKQVRSGVPFSAGPEQGRESAASRILGAVPTALVCAGVAATALWAGFLAWCLVAVVRWTIG
ncbi:MAG: hypothetical protein JWR08_970 [Enterovirga sp.]|nr:hypothetical protein [Enterovirga sp.]